VKKTNFKIINGLRQKEHNFRVYNVKLEIVNSFCYLGISISNKGDFKVTLEHLYNKASRAYFSLRQDFNFQNNASPKVIIKLFDSMIKPILLYGSEIWAVFGWKQNNCHSIQKFLFNDKHKFEALHVKVCRNILGVHKRAAEIMVRAELGRYPLMLNIIQHIYGYWQHILNTEENSLLSKTLKILIENDRQGYINYYSRLKGLLTVLNAQQLIYKGTKIEIKRNCCQIKTIFQENYKTHFFKTLKEKATRENSGGRFEIYYNVKRQYKFEEYLSLNKNNLRRNITNIRISTHNLPIETLRKSKIERSKRKCTLCQSGEIGSEIHDTMLCQNKTPKLDNFECTLIKILKKLYISGILYPSHKSLFTLYIHML
jgi:hypothetical protein